MSYRLRLLYVGDGEHFRQPELDETDVRYEQDQEWLCSNMRALLVPPVKVNPKNPYKNAERDFLFIRKYYGIEKEQIHSFKMLGKELNITRERARQIHKNTLVRLREECLASDHDFEGYLNLCGVRQNHNKVEE